MVNRSDRDPPNLNTVQDFRVLTSNEAWISSFHQGQQAWACTTGRIHNCNRALWLHRISKSLAKWEASIHAV